MDDVIPITFMQFVSQTINQTYPVAFIAMILSTFAWGHRFLLFLRISKQNNELIKTIMDEISRSH